MIASRPAPKSVGTGGDTCAVPSTQCSGSASIWLRRAIATSSINASEEHMRRNGRIRPAKNCQMPFKAERYTTIGGAKDTTCRPYRNERDKPSSRTCVALYNQQLPQSALSSRTPLQAMKDWHKLKPELFRKQPYYLPGCDSYTTISGAKDTTCRPYRNERDKPYRCNF